MIRKIKKRCPELILPTDEEYLECVKDILRNESFLSMQNFIQHGTTTCLEHCLNVSYCSYVFCKKHNLNYRAAARAGLLHDLFLYDWHFHAKLTGNRFHGLTHPRRALENAGKEFKLNDIEANSILRHMFPLTPHPPRYREGLVIMWYDKVCGLKEVFRRPAYRQISAFG